MDPAALLLIRAFASAFLSILFLQSGVDKVIHYKGEQAFYEKHFASSPLRSFVFLLLPILTTVEVLAGVLSLAGLVLLLFSGETKVAYWGILVANSAFLMLFFGQRMAKDYAGAASLVPYFLVGLVALAIYAV